MTIQSNLILGLFKIIFLSFVLLPFFFSGCRYKPISQEFANDVYIEIRDYSEIPQFELVVKRKIREELFSSGNYKLCDKSSESDIIVSLTINPNQKRGEIFRDNDPILASAVTNEISASIKITNKNASDKLREGNYIFTSSVIRSSEYGKGRYGKSQINLAGQLSKKIVRMLML